MAEEDQTETVETKAAETAALEQNQTVVRPGDQAPETIESLKAKLAEAERKAQNKTEEAERHFKKLSKFEQEETKSKEAEMTELQKAQAKAEAAEAKARQLEIEKMQLSTATKIGIPLALADRLKGETLEDMEADATKILESLPKQGEQRKPSPGAITNPGANGGTQETREEKRARLMGTPPDIWKGSGINWNENPKE